MVADALIIGGGFIGGAVARAAAADGRIGSVSVLVRHALEGYPPGVHVLQGDARAADLGLDANTAAKVRERTSVVVVAVGGVDFGMSIAQAQSEHVAAVQGAVEFAKHCPSRPRVVLISSLLAAGARSGRIRSDWLPPSGYHRNFYEWAKQTGERIVRSSGLPSTIIRPGHVMNATDGHTRTTRALGLFEALPAIAARWPLPLAADVRYWSAPVDLVASTTVAAALDDNNSSVWCVDPDSPTIGELLDVLAFRHGLATKRLVIGRAAEMAAALISPRRLGLRIPKGLLDYLMATYDLDLRCQMQLWERNEIASPSRQYLADTIDWEIERLRSLS